MKTSLSAGVSITADPVLPIIHTTRDVQVPPAQLQHVHVDQLDALLVGDDV